MRFFGRGLPNLISEEMPSRPKQRRPTPDGSAPGASKSKGGVIEHGDLVVLFRVMFPKGKMGSLFGDRQSSYLRSIFRWHDDDGSAGPFDHVKGGAGADGQEEAAEEEEAEEEEFMDLD